MNRIVWIVFSLLLLAACKEDKLVNVHPIGSWKVVEKNGKAVTVSDGYQFAEDFQYFALDSQARPIVRFHPKYWELKNDTLILVDMNFEERFRAKKGTTRFYVLRLEADVMELESLDSDKPEVILFERI